METLAAIQTRRSVRKFQTVPVEWDIVGRIVEAGAAAPSSGNTQDFKFIIVTEENRRRDIAHACFDQNWMADAPVHIVITSEIKRAQQYYGIRGERLYCIQNAAAAAMNCLLAAHDLGVASCFVSGFDEEMLRAAVNIPDYARPQVVLPIGYADEVPPEPPKFKIENVSFFERYNNRIKYMHIVLGRYSSVVEDAAKGAAKSVNKGAKSILDKVSGHAKKLKDKVNKK